MSNNYLGKQLLLIDDDLGCRRSSAASGLGSSRALSSVSMYSISRNVPAHLDTVTKSENNNAFSRYDVLRNYLTSHVISTKKSIVIAGAVYGTSVSIHDLLRHYGKSYIVELQPSTRIVVKALDKNLTCSELITQSQAEEWNELKLVNQQSNRPFTCKSLCIGSAVFAGDIDGQLWIFQTGGIHGVHRGTVIAFSSDYYHDAQWLASSIFWTRWIRPLERKSRRRTSSSVSSFELASNSSPTSLFDANVQTTQNSSLTLRNGSEQSRTSTGRLNVVELFAGAGGLGLGFLMANQTLCRKYHIRFTGELHPVYTQTLRINHKIAAEKYCSGDLSTVPEAIQPVDLSQEEAFEQVLGTTSGLDRVDLVIGGPPCQGFSPANRNSWHSENPNNRLINTFLRYLELLKPRAFVMENVEGITYTPKSDHPDEISVLDFIAISMRRLGYEVFPVRVNAAEYGAPQVRLRIFIIGVHLDVSLDKGDFPSGRLFPAPQFGLGRQPYISLHQAISDLPEIDNGESRAIQPYTEPNAASLEQNPYLALMRHGADSGLITDHVTSRHAAYVIDRYKQIPEGGNWKSIEHMLTNYANADRTHSNIYKRLKNAEPSVTIGHYRKSMLVHPTQHRGLSLREAARLQSFPDWFRFAGAVEGGKDSIGHKQQQLANAVCPLVSKAMAEFLESIL